MSSTSRTTTTSIALDEQYSLQFIGRAVVAVAAAGAVGVGRIRSAESDSTEIFAIVVLGVAEFDEWTAHTGTHWAVSRPERPHGTSDRAELSRAAKLGDNGADIISAGDK